MAGVLPRQGDYPACQPLLIMEEVQLKPNPYFVQVNKLYYLHLSKLEKQTKEERKLFIDFMKVQIRPLYLLESKD